LSEQNRQDEFYLIRRLRFYSRFLDRIERSPQSVQSLPGCRQDLLFGSDAILA
jgi:hypothetical protein